MQISDIKNGKKIKPLKLSVSDTPHVAIETNLTCNIRCRGCYNLFNTYVKPMAQIKADIDLAFEKRNLETITILGGEPTLHPDLVEIIRYIKEKNVVCEMLTNGVVFLKDDGDRLLEDIVSAGLDRIVLHVDIGQSEVHADINAVRHTLFKKFSAQKIFFGLSITIYSDNQGIISALMKEFSKYRYFEGLLATLRMQTPHNFFNYYISGNNDQLLFEYKRISEELGIEPTTYIPSSLSDDKICWLNYFYYFNTKTQKSMRISPKYSRLFRRVYRRLTGKYPFGLTTSIWLFPFSFLFSCLVEIILHPKKISAIAGLLRRSMWLKNIRFQFIMIQKGPEYNHAKKQIEICYHCPDATIRNGKLTPLCAADMINPLQENAPGIDIPDELSQTIFTHLEQI